MRLLRNLGAREALSARPALSVALAAVFAGVATLFAVGWLPRTASGVVTRGETVVMTAACAVIAVYFAHCARLGRRRK